MAGRAHERETAAQRRLDRSSRREARGLARRPACDRVAVEERRPVNLGDAVDMRLRMAEQKLVVACAPSFDEVGEVLQEDGEPLLSLRMAAPGRMELGERRVRQDVDRTISATSASERSPCARPTR
jgi:hypothetical protein